MTDETHVFDLSNWKMEADIYQERKWEKAGLERKVKSVSEHTS